jgi:aspartate/glutamate racemase
MKRIGLLGGMSWESSAEYYRLINEATRERLGGLHSADCLLRSVDFAEIEQLQRDGAWDEAGERLAAEASALVAGGAELLVLCTNTMHKVADAIADVIDVPSSTSPTRRHMRCEPAVCPALAYSRPRTPWSMTSTSAACVISTI